MYLRLSLFLFSLLFTTIGYGQMRVFEKYDDFQSQIIDKRNSDTLYLVNYWATWCKPCVKELPYFEEINQSNDLVQVILVSLDFKHQIKTKLIPFVEQTGYSSEFVLLEDSNYNDWINKVDPTWSGAIPASIFYYKDQTVFKEKQYHSAEELQTEINNILNN